MNRPAVSPKTSRFVLLATVCLVIAILYFAKEVLIPIALAVLLSFLLTPPASWLERWKLPRVAATLIVVLLGVSILVGVGVLVGSQAVTLVNDLPKYQTQLQTKFKQIGSHGGFFKKAQKDVEAIGKTSSSSKTEAPAGVPSAPPTPVFLPGASAEHSAAAPTPENPLPVRQYPVASTNWQMLHDYAGTVLGPLATAGLVLVFVIFMLLSREDLRDRLIRLLGHGRLNLTTQALDEASSRISSYLGALAVVNGCYALCTALGLWLLGKFLGHGLSFPNVLVWGLLVGLSRFIPYIGIVIGAGLPLLLSFGIFPGNSVFFGTLAMFAILEVVVGQFIEPMWYGSSTGMSPLAVLVAAVFWTWLWGGIGLLLSTPMTVLLVVMGKYIPQLKFLDILLREKPVLSLHYRFYQRLMALDQEEAADLAHEYLKDKKSLEATYDDLLIPALSLAESDHHRDKLGKEQLEFVHQSVRDLVEELAEQYLSMLKQSETTSTPKTAAAAGAEPVKQETTVFAHAASTVSAAATSVANVAAKVAEAVTGTASKEPAKPKHLPPDESIVHNPRHLPEGCALHVLCLPARDEADEIVAIMLAQLLEVQGYCAFTPSASALASEMVEMVESKKIDLVCVAAMPPAAVTHARYLCKRLQARFPDIAMLVGLWSLKGDLSRAKERIAGSSAIRVVTTLKEAREQIEEIAQPLIVKATAQSTNNDAGSVPVSTAIAT